MSHDCEYASVILIQDGIINYYSFIVFKHKNNENRIPDIYFTSSMQQLLFDTMFALDLYRPLIIWLCVTRTGN